MTTLSQSIHQWLRHWLGTHGYTRALKDRGKRDRLDEIVGRIERGELDGHEVRAVFAEAARRNLKIDEVFAALAPPERITTPRGMRGALSVVPAARASATVAGRAAAPVSSGHRPAANPPAVKTTVLPAPAAPATAPAVEAELRALRAELERSRGHALELENLARGLVERALLDATRIRGLEEVIMAIAKGSGIDGAAAEVYAKATRDYLTKREVLLRRARAA